MNGIVSTTLWLLTSNRCIHLEPPSTLAIVASLEYLYTGELSTGLDPEMLFGIIQNAQYLMCEKLSKDCYEKLTKKILGEEVEAYISHSAFDVMWVPKEMVDRCMRKLKPYLAIRMIVMWLRRQTALDPGINDIAKYCKENASKLKISEIKTITALSPTIAFWLGIPDTFYDKIALAIYKIGSGDIYLASWTVILQ